MYSTVGDMHRFMQGLLSNRLLSEATRKTMHSVQAKMIDMPSLLRGYGYGFFITRTGQAFRIGHGGGMRGVGSRFETYPELGYTVVVLSNYGFPANTVADHIRDILSPD